MILRILFLFSRCNGFKFSRALSTKIYSKNKIWFSTSIYCCWFVSTVDFFENSRVLLTYTFCRTKRWKLRWFCVLANVMTGQDLESLFAQERFMTRGPETIKSLLMLLECATHPTDDCGSKFFIHFVSPFF